MKNVKCCMCGNNISISNDTYYHGKKRNPTNPQFYCKSCYKIMKAERMKQYSWNNLSDKEKENRINKIQEKYKNLSDEEKKQKSEKQSLMMKERWNNASEKELEKMRDSARNAYKNLSDEKKKELSEKAKNRYKNMTKEELSKIGQHVKDWYNNLSEEEKINYANSKRKWYENLSEKEKEEHSQRQKDFWNNMTEEEYIKQCQLQSDGWKNLDDEKRIKYNNKKKEWWDKLSDEEKAIHLEKSNWYSSLSDEEKAEHIIKSIKPFNDMTPEEKAAYAQKQRDIWNSLSNETKMLRVKKILSSSKNGINNLSKKFEDTFNSSHLVNYYYIKPEIMLSNGTFHSWDYGIYDKSSNQLTMVVDLDGEYFHADNCDYDGIHSNEEYDEKRSLSVPDNIKIFIIQEMNFSKCFKLMTKTLIKDYDEYIENMFKLCRSMPFPYQKYSDIELLKSYEKLRKMKCDDKYHQDISLNTRIGDRIINHFHESIYHAHTKGNISPYNAWYNDELLKKTIENRIIYQNYLNPNKILQGFNISKIATKVSVFSAGRAKLLIYKYLNKYDVIFDPFSGFSGRMLGCISLGKQYIGQDISDIHVRESNNMIEFLKRNAINISTSVENKDILQSYGEYDCLFTCPPYSDKEQWLDVKIDTRSCDDWIDECLSRFKCRKYLFVVDNTVKYKEYIVDEIMNKSHLNKNSEYVILIQR